MSPRIAVIYNDDAALAHGEARDAIAVEAVAGAARAIAASLRARGHAVEVLGVGPDARGLMETVAGLDAELVFNQVEALGGDARKEQAFAWLLELCGVPYTGSGPRAMALCVEKPVTRAVLASRGVPVPRGAVLERGDEPLGGLRFPLIVKPVREDASHGIAHASVVHDERAARERARWVIASYAQAALVEEFVAEREINVALLDGPRGLEVLPLSEIDYSGFDADMARIVTYEGKWVETSRDWDRTKVIAARDFAPAQRARIEAVARAAFEAVGLADYGRVDLRLDARGEPFVIDVNENPDLTPDAGFALAAARAGMDHADLIQRIVASSLARRAAAAPGR